MASARDGRRPSRRTFMWVDMRGERSFNTPYQAAKAGRRMEDPAIALPGARPGPSMERQSSMRGFNLHASVAVAAEDDLGRERLMRYYARPPLALDRLRRVPAGRIAYRIKKLRDARAKNRVMTPFEGPDDRLEQGQHAGDHPSRRRRCQPRIAPRDPLRSRLPSVSSHGSPKSRAMRFSPRHPSLFYGIPTNVVTLCPVSVRDTREFATVAPEPWARLLLAEVSHGMSVHGGEPEI